MAKQDPGEQFVFQDVTVTSSTNPFSTLENLPDEFRKLLPPELLAGIRQGTFETPGLSALQKNDPTFDPMALLQRATTIIGAVRDAEQNGQWDMVRVVHVTAVLPALAALGARAA
jgi:hypothetical protein